MSEFLNITRKSLPTLASIAILSGCASLPPQLSSVESNVPTASNTYSPNTSPTVPSIKPETSVMSSTTPQILPTSSTTQKPNNPTTEYSTIFTEKSSSDGLFRTTVELGNGYRKIATISLKCATETVDGKKISGVPFSGMTTEDKNGVETYPVHGFPETPDWMNPCDKNNTIKESAKTKPNTNAAFFGTVALSNKAYDWMISFSGIAK